MTLSDIQYFSNYYLNNFLLSLHIQYMYSIITYRTIFTSEIQRKRKLSV